MFSHMNKLASVSDTKHHFVCNNALLPIFILFQIDFTKKIFKQEQKVCLYKHVFSFIVATEKKLDLGKACSGVNNNRRNVILPIFLKRRKFNTALFIRLLSVWKRFFGAFQNSN